MKPALWLAMALAAMGPVYDGRGGFTMAPMANVPLTGNVTFDFPSTNIAACSTTTLTVAGAAVNSGCIVTHAAVTSGGSTIFRCNVGTLNTVTVSACCGGNAACNPSSAQFFVTVFN